MVMVPVLGFVVVSPEVGENTTLIVQLLPPARTKAQLPPFRLKYVGNVGVPIPSIGFPFGLVSVTV